MTFTTPTGSHPPRRRTSAARIFVGVIVLALGVLLLLSAMGVLPFSTVGPYLWPGVVTLLGVALLFSSPPRYALGALVILFGVAWGLNQAGIIAPNPWRLIWPVALIVFGLLIVFGGAGYRRRRGAPPYRQPPAPGGATGTPRPDDGPTPFSTSSRSGHIGVVLGSRTANRWAGPVSFASADVLLGEGVIDLRRAELAPEVEVMVNVYLGGATILVPPGVRIQSDASVIMGGIDDRTAEGIEGGQCSVITITGQMIMGGITVKY